jgi:hypothetical protein
MAPPEEVAIEQRTKMLKYEYINKEWIVSPSAGRIYRISAVLSLILFVVWLGALSQQGRIPPDITPLSRLLLLAGVLGAAITLIGMEYFLFRFDTSHPLKQILWFVIMLFPLLGPPLYCFFVYSRSDVLKEACGKQTDNR